MGGWEVVQAKPEHAKFIAENMRQADVHEVWASSKHTPIEAIVTSMSLSQETWVGLGDGEPIIIVGIVKQDMFNRGVPWMLGTDALPPFTRPFLRYVKELQKRWLDECSFLFNYVDARHTVSVRWLQWMGFEVMEAEPFGPYNMPFHNFYMRS